MRLFLFLGLLLSLVASAQTAAPKKAPALSFSPVPRFKDVAREAGLTVSHRTWSKSSGSKVDCCLPEPLRQKGKFSRTMQFLLPLEVCGLNFFG